MMYDTILNLFNHAQAELKLAVCNEEVAFWGDRVNKYTKMLLERNEMKKG